MSTLDFTGSYSLNTSHPLNTIIFVFDGDMIELYFSQLLDFTRGDPASAEQLGFRLENP